MSYIKSWSHLKTKTYKCNYEKAKADLFQINFAAYESGDAISVLSLPVKVPPVTLATFRIHSTEAC